MTQDVQKQFLAEITKTVEQSIETVVNGKIRKLDEKVTAYIERDEQWKKDADPYIKLASNLSGSWKFLVYVVGGLLAFLGFYNLIIR